MSVAGYELYLLRCADGSLYTGIARDADKRLLEHQGGTRGARYLRGRAPLAIVYRVAAGDRSSASRLEYFVKQLSKADKETLVAGGVTLEELFPQLEVAGSIE